MVREVTVGWWVFEAHGPSVTVHKGNCPKVLTRLGDEEPGGKWHGPFESRTDAESIAQGLKPSLSLCPRCS